MSVRLAMTWIGALALTVSCGGGDGGESDLTFPDAVQDSTSVDTSETGPVNGTPCDDEDPCTQGDEYADGVCAGAPYDCTTGSPFCITRSCDGEGGCVVLKVQAGFCFVDGACFAEDSANPSDGCALCDPAVDQDAWSPAPGVTECSDGDACTLDDHCDKGKCVGGQTKDCDDKNPCTEDTCDEGLGCVHENREGACEDGDLCTLADTCVEGVCEAGWEVPDCDDGNPCSVDTCVAATGCVNTVDAAVACNDENECTLETCDTQTGCGHEPMEGPCEDGDLCTLDDFCQAGVCETGAGVPDCTNDNECTDDFCSPLAGCIHANLPGECDDNESCTIDDVCLGGKCTGKKTGDCDVCEVVNTHANKVTVLQMGTSGHPGQGLDLDDDPLTCAPSTDCSGGIDNELGILAPFVNSGLADSVDQGHLTYITEFVDFDKEGAPFSLNFVASYLSDTNPFCDFQYAECAYVVFQDALDVDCNAIMAFDNATLDGTKLTAGGTNYTFGFQASLIGGAIMVISIANAQIEAKVQFTQGGSQIFSVQGFLGGAVDKAELLDTIGKLPDDVLPMDKEIVITMLDTLIVNDLDTDGDGTPDAASVAIRFDTIPANIVPGE